MFAKIFTLAILPASLFSVAFVNADAKTDGKKKSCCELQLACCKPKSACCVADVRLGCCEKGMKCCEEKRACCTGVQKCCQEGSACCEERKACCGEKVNRTEVSLLSKSPLSAKTSARSCCESNSRAALIASCCSKNAAETDVALAELPAGVVGSGCPNCVKTAEAR